MMSNGATTPETSTEVASPSQAALLDDERYVVTFNTNTVELDSWNEAELLPDGSIKLIGMGSKLERTKEGEIVSFSKSPTGVAMIIPAPEPQKGFIARLLGI